MIARPRGTYILWEMLSLRSTASINIKMMTTGMKQGFITFFDHLLATLVRSLGIVRVREHDKQN